MAKKRFVIKMGSFEPKRGGKKQPGLDLSRTVEDTIVDDSLATRTSDCCYLFPSVPDIDSLGVLESNVPDNSFYLKDSTLHYKDITGTISTVNLTEV